MHYAPLALWSQTEKRSLIWLENRRVVRNLDSSSEKYTHACSQQQGGRSRGKLPRALACFLWLPYCTPRSVPSTPSQLSASLSTGPKARRRVSRCGGWNRCGPGTESERVRMAIAGSCWGGIPTAVLPPCIFIEMLGGEGDDMVGRRWDGWMASLTPWTWVWASSGSWWWTGKPGVLQSMGSQRVGHDWATELNWTELNAYMFKIHGVCCCPLPHLLNRG